MPEGSKYLNDHTCVTFNNVQIQATFKQLANDLGIKKICSVIILSKRNTFLSYNLF